MATEQTPFKKEDPEREKWGNQCDFFLSCLGFAVGLGNVWRFPYLCYKHGGGSFLIAYITMIFLTGLPLFFLELTLGQYSSIGPSKIFQKLCPAAKGVGWGMISVSLLIALYYNQIIAWSLFYMYEGLTWELPWKWCANHFNTIGCFTLAQNQACLNASRGLELFWNNTCYPISEICEAVGLEKLNTTHCFGEQGTKNILHVMNRTTASEDYFTSRVLGLRKDSSWDNMGSVQIHALISLIGAWIIVGLCMIKGIQSSGKVVYFTALFPFVVLIMLFVRGLMLDGAYEGILFYVTPKWENLQNPQIWADAATQIFYSLGTTMGGLVTLASYNRFNNNCLRDAFIICLSNCATSIFAGFVIFSIVGFMAKELDLPISEVIKSGPGLTFVAYPDAVTRLPGAPIWSFLFFMMILTLGLDTQFAMTETVTTAIMDQWPSCRRHQTLVVIMACSIGCGFGVSMCLNGGMYVFQLFNWYSASWNLMLIGLLEILVVVTCLGFGGIMDNLRAMEVRVPWILELYFGITWRLLTPLSLGVVSKEKSSPALNSISTVDKSKDFISMARDLGLRFVDGKDRENANDIGNDDDFLLDFHPDNLHKMASLFGHGVQPRAKSVSLMDEEEETSTSRLPMKNHSHRDEPPTDLIMVDDVAEPVYEADESVVEVTTAFPEYLTETLYYFDKESPEGGRFASNIKAGKDISLNRTPRTPFTPFETHKTRKILQVFHDSKEEQDHMMMMLHNAVAMVEMEDRAQNLRPIAIDNNRNGRVFETGGTSSRPGPSRPIVRKKTQPRRPVVKPRPNLIQNLQKQTRVSQPRFGITPNPLGSLPRFETPRAQPTFPPPTPTPATPTTPGFRQNPFEATTQTPISITQPFRIQQSPTFQSSPPLSQVPRRRNPGGRNRGQSLTSGPSQSNRQPAIYLTPRPRAPPQVFQTVRPRLQDQFPEPRPVRPEPRAQRPESRTQRPVSRTQRPQPRPERPVQQTQRPETRTQRPQPQPERPESRAQRPQGQPQRPQVQPQRPQVQPQRPQVQPQRPQVQPRRPEPRTQRPEPQTPRTEFRAQWPNPQTPLRESQPKRPERPQSVPTISPNTISNEIIETGSNQNRIQKPRKGKQNTSTLTEIPQTNFSCRNQEFPGLYADPEANCQVFYMCQSNGRENSFLCPAGTLFDQRFLVCNWWYKVDCSQASSYYDINEGIYQ